MWHDVPVSNETTGAETPPPTAAGGGAADHIRRPGHRPRRAGPAAALPDTPETGLTAAEAEERRARGLGNDARIATGRSYPDILRDNVLQPVNILLAIICLVLAALGLYGDAAVTIVLVLVNIVVGLFQEVRAKRRRYDRLLRREERQLHPDRRLRRRRIRDRLVHVPGDRGLHSDRDRVRAGRTPSRAPERPVGPAERDGDERGGPDLTRPRRSRSSPTRRRRRSPSSATGSRASLRRTRRRSRSRSRRATGRARASARSATRSTARTRRSTTAPSTTRELTVRSLTRLKVRGLRQGRERQHDRHRDDRLARRQARRHGAGPRDREGRWPLPGVRLSTTRRSLAGAAMTRSGLKHAAQRWRFMLPSGTSIVQLRLPTGSSGRPPTRSSGRCRRLTQGDEDDLRLGS